MELIDKDTLLSEIEKRMQELNPTDTHKMQTGERMSTEVLMWLNALTWVKKTINSLKTKDVDLEKEIDKWYDTAPDEFEKINFEHIENCAKHFFELGLRTKEGKK